MRRRRAERCVLRAQVALEAGFLEDARAALEEARQLQPSLPEIATLEQQLVEASVAASAVQTAEPAAAASLMPEPAAAASLLAELNGAAASSAEPAIAPRDRRRRVPLVLFGALALAAGLGFSAWMRTADAVTEPSRPTRPDVVLPAEPIVQSDLIAPAITLVEPQPERPAPPIEERPREERPPEERPATSRAISPPVPVDVPRSTPLPSPPPRVVSPPASSPAPTEVVNPGAGLSPVTLPAAPESTPPPAPPPAPAVDERVRIRAVLSRYEAAYSGLDASAARQVWPGVDERALARAFDGLASQRLSLGRCDVSVSGGSAHANCSGTATWTPKVGGGGRTENRRWQFDLSKAGDDWQIVRAIAR